MIVNIVGAVASVWPPQQFGWLTGTLPLVCAEWSASSLSRWVKRVFGASPRGEI